MIYLALMIVALIVGGNVYEVSSGTWIVVEEPGSYTVKINGFDRARVWLPRGSYNITISEMSLDGGALRGLVIVISNVSLSYNKNIFIYSESMGYNLNLELSFPRTGDCKADTTFWLYHYMDILEPYLERSVKIEEDSTTCKIIIDTGEALGFLQVSQDRWASITITGQNYTVAIAYGVELGEADGLPGKTVSREGEGRPITPIPVSVTRDSYFMGVFNYTLIIGLLLILAFVAVAEFVSSKRGY